MTLLCYGRQGIFATNSREQQEIASLCLQLLQNCLMLINSILVEQTIDAAPVARAVEPRRSPGTHRAVLRARQSLWPVCARCDAALLPGGRLMTTPCAAQSDGQETGAPPAPAASRLSLPQESVSAYARAAGARRRSRRQAVAGITHGCGIGRLLCHDLACPPAHAYGDAQSCCCSLACAMRNSCSSA